MAATDALNIVLGAGGVAFLGTLYKGIKEYREGSWQRRDAAVADLEQWRRDSDDAREWQAVQHEWWRDWAGRLEYALTRAGIPLPEKYPYPTKPTASTVDDASRKRGSRHSASGGRGSGGRRQSQNAGPDEGDGTR